nr:MAG TPA: GCN4 leucine zipper coil protein [Crassvirales sp.]
MYNEVLITGVIGFCTTILSGWTSWFFARKKYNSEVDGNLINNMKESLDFYEKLSSDNRDRLEEVLKRNSELEKEISELRKEAGELRKQVFGMMSTICLDLTCQLRKVKVEPEAIKEPNGNTDK